MKTAISTAKTSLKLSACLAIKSVISATLLLTSLNTTATIMRHDVDPMEYLLDSFEYQSVIHSENSSATLIAERWVLTAAHTVDANYGHTEEQYGKLTIMGQEYTVKAFHIHPEYVLTDDTVLHDIALVELEEPVLSIEPSKLYEGSDEIGQTAKLAGYGHIGDGINGVTSECFPCDLRGADNVIFDGDEDMLGVRFDDPNEGQSLPLEGVSGPGDSGGPLFIENELGRYVAGVSSVGGNFYNELDGFTRVSTHLNWLVDVMGDDFTGEYAGPLYSEQNATGTVKVEVKVKKTESSGGSFNSAALLLIGLLVSVRRLSRKS